MWRLASFLILSTMLACQAESPSEAPSPTGPRLVRGELPVAPFVAGLEKKQPGKVLVYVGASWCEPCRAFHDALERGELDAVLPGIAVVEYDLDQHKQALSDAGYRARLIPIFALPEADGRASSRMISGSIKGERAVADNIAPRLSALLGAAGAK